MATWLVTGGAGFIGGNFVLEAVARGVRVVNLDANTEYPVKGPCRLMLHEVAVELNLF